MRRQTGLWLCSTALAVAISGAAFAGDAKSGSLATAEFPDVVKFDFERVTQHYEDAGTNIGKVGPLIEDTLKRGEEAVQAGEVLKANPTDENKRLFINGVMRFVRGAADSKASTGGLWEEVRAIQCKMGILYAQGQTQTEARLEELRKEFGREELKYKEVVARNKERRRNEKLNDWEMRKLFEEEKRQTQALNRVADRIAFQEDFRKALNKAAGESTGDFNLYDQYFAEAGDVFTNIADLASNLPLVVERLQVAAALEKNMPNRKGTAQGFEKIERTKQLTQQLASQLMELCSGDLAPASDSEQQVIVKHTESYKRWMQGESLEYKRPVKATK